MTNRKNNDVYVKEEEPLSPLASPYVGTLDVRKGTDDISDDDDKSSKSFMRSRAHSNDDALRRSHHHRPGSTVSFRLDEESPLIKPQDTFDDAEENNTETGPTSVLGAVSEAIEEAATEAWTNLTEIQEEAWGDYKDSSHYDWREYWKGGGLIKFVRFVLTGFTPKAKQTDDEIQENLNSLARMLSLLREYYDRFGLPEKGGPKDHEYILREIIKDLYAGGAPLWTLQPVMKKVAEGLTGQRGVDFFMLPRRAFIFTPSSGATSMFSITRGYDMAKLDAMEHVAVRLASFASNTHSVANVPARFPNPQELRRAFRTESLAGFKYSKEEMTEEILNLASDAEGLFFFINSRKYRAATRDLNNTSMETKHTELGDFWTVEDEIRDLFSRLAAIETVTNIDKIDIEWKPLYSRPTIAIFRFLSSAGACAFWFNGSWLDIGVSGTLAVFIAWIGASPVLSSQERIIFEAIASFLVGIIAGLISLHFPNHSCFSAMAIAGVLDLLQGFRVVYAIIEIMGRHTVTGGADFLEGIFFTTLIAYFLKFGQYSAEAFHGAPKTEAPPTCNNGVSQWWYFLFVPLASFSWAGLFNPNYFDLPLMGCHGIIAYLVSWQFYKTVQTGNINNFIAAMAVTFSAGIASRFTGRQALGNTIAGLYVLLPGVFLVTEIYNERIQGFLTTIIVRAVIIGLGAWTGTILCSPILLGTTHALLQQGRPGMDVTLSSGHGSLPSPGSSWRRRDRTIRKSGPGALLYF